jgi:endonuclease III related protein
MKSFSSGSQNSDQTTHATGITEEDLLTYYHFLYTSFGDQGWWPSSGWFETIIGAVLAQNVSWDGASQAVSSLKEAGLLDPEKILQSSQEVIAPLIRSSRYYNQKAERILIFVRFFADRYGSDSVRMNQEETGILRSLLLNLKGFGPETVDSILLYACEKPVFVVDAYTRRIGSRIGLFKTDASYQQMQDFFMVRLNPDMTLLNDYHAQIVHLGNTICRTRPFCKSCPLRKMDGRLQCTYDQTDP